MAMRTVSPSARARVQSRLSTAAAAAVFFSSALREVGIAFLPETVSSVLRLSFCLFLFFLVANILRGCREKPTRAPHPRLATISKRPPRHKAPLAALDRRL